MRVGRSVYRGVDAKKGGVPVGCGADKCVGVVAAGELESEERDVTIMRLLLLSVPVVEGLVELVPHVCRAGFDECLYGFLTIR